MRKTQRRRATGFACWYAATLACCGNAGSVDAPGAPTASSAATIPFERPAEAVASAGPTASAAASGESQSSEPVIGTGATGSCSDFTSSFDALQKLVLERHGCSASTCHGAAMLGGLDLRGDAAYAHLVNTSSTESKLLRVKPGDPEQSYMYLKLQAATDPASKPAIINSPMPIGTNALSSSELQAFGLWIKQGAPQQGIVTDDNGRDVTSFLEACQNQAVDKPLEDNPLAPPAPDKGVQIVFPQYVLEAHAETETCTPFAYDLTDQVPAAYKDADNTVIYVNGSHVRQSPGSHHLIVWDPRADLTTVKPDDPDWTCHGGDNAGKQCNAQHGSADCGTFSACAGPTNPGSLCGIETLAFGSGSQDDILKALLGGGQKPLTEKDIQGLLALVSNPNGMPAEIANAQTLEENVPALDGIYMKMPLKGIMWFNSHAFNITEQEITLQVRTNWLFATKREREMLRQSNIDNNGMMDGQPPFTRKSYCAKTEVPQNYSLVTLTGHYHHRGEHFTIADPSGKQLYENVNYSDPAYTHFDPWLVFEATSAAARTLEYCATYNNGVKVDGTPDVERVTRSSRMPARGQCTPVACVAGKVSASCKTDRDCDSAPGANDGACDACNLTAGQTTENEMFVMTGWYVLPPGVESGAKP